MKKYGANDRGGGSVPLVVRVRLFAGNSRILVRKEVRKMEYRIEHDSMGEVKVPADAAKP